ncbi:MAG: ribosome recycling factor [Marinilabiliales bacterium]|nr:MAG: ribosome recycling factor [Marinilabiliales bacterium]
MEEEVQMILDIAEEKMEKALTYLRDELAKLRAGKASPHMLDGITVDYYGATTPLNQVSNINTPDPRSITIQPWEKSMLEPIEKAIQQANLGFNPVNNGEILRIVVPALTEERRKNLVRQVRGEGENARVSIRNARREANEELKRMQKDGLPEDAEKRAEQDVQKLTDSYSEKIEEVLKNKEEDIMTI